MLRKTNGIVIILCLFMLCAAIIHAEGPETIPSLYAPMFLSGGASVVSENPPFADALNPAASADNQLITLDLSYITMTGDTNMAGWGHVINLGASFPTKAGVISGSGNFLYSPNFSELNLGTQGGINISFAKDLFPNFHVGMGLHGYFGQGWAVGADLGFIQFAGNVGFLKGLEWGVALRNLGYSTLPDTEDYPRMYTLQAGAKANLINREPFRFDTGLDLSFPGFTNARMQLGGSLFFKDFLNLRFETTADLREMIDSDFSALIPSFGVAFTFGLDVKEEKDILKLEEKGWGESNLTVTTAAGPMENGLWALGAGVHMPLGNLDNQPPEIGIEYTGTEYISPNHDGIKDELVVPISITDSRFIKEYAFTIVNGDGETVRTIVNKEIRAEDVEFKNILSRLAYVKTGIPIPEEIRWDGYSDNGVTVPDGEYTFSLEAADDNGNRGIGESYTIIVDNTPPELTMGSYEGEALIFSPNNDGNKDTFGIIQSGSTEDLWQGEVKSVDGRFSRKFQWENSGPEDFQWDGTGTDGTLVQDGVYLYTLEATDRAGNSTAGKITNIIKNTQETPISLSIDTSYFAPAVEGSRNSLTFTPQVPVTTGIESWSLTIKNDKGNQVRSFRGGTNLEGKVVFDGTSDQGRVVAEGAYRGVLEVSYINGNRPTSESPLFTVDRTRPKADVTVEKPAVFSPDGDGMRDMLTFYQDTSPEGTWKGTIRNVDGDEVKNFLWIERADPVFIWDGYDSVGRIVPDGEYSYMLESVDKAMNLGTSEVVFFKVDTIPTPVSLRIEKEAFSPNGDGKMDELVFIPTIEVTEGISEYTFRIISEEGDTVWTRTGRASVPARITWDGFNNAGERASDGTYAGEITVRYDKGDKSVAVSRKVLLDTMIPSLEISAPYVLFSPDGDGRKDFLPIAQQSSNETLWTAEILDAEGQTIRQLLWKGSLADFNWDGTDEAGNRVRDGVYTYRVSCEDKAGNAIMRKLEGIRVDTAPTTIFATADAEGFTPNGDGRNEEITINLLVNQTAGVSGWTLEILDTSHAVVRKFSEVRIPRQIIWNGEDENGRTHEGVYTARFSVEYDKGNKPVSETTSFLLDITPPQVDIALQPVPFSPDNDGLDDELTIRIGVSDPSGVKSWKMTILDRAGHVFQIFKGEGEPASSIVWDGKGMNGDLVLSAEDYPYTFEAIDNYGLKTIKEGIIPIDVLVVREGNKLKIQIANITFAPNSPLFVTDDPAIVEKNDYVIERIAQILKKYASYRITIEGHAVNLSWADPVKMEREEREELLELSRQRAQTVKDKLVALGVDASRINVIGMGGTKPLVPHSDLDNRWKNRRVEFILEK